MNNPEERALIIAPNWIGDCLMAQPLLALLKRQGQRLTILAPPWVAPIFQGMPQLQFDAAHDELIEAHLAHGKLQLRQRWQLARQLRGKFSRAYVLPNSLKSSLIPWLAGIPQRIGYLGEHRYGLLNHIHRTSSQRTPRVPMVQYYAALASTPLASTPLASTPLASSDAVLSEFTQPQLMLPTEQSQQALKKFAVSGKPLIAFCPGAEYGAAKRWPIEHFAQLATLIHAQYPDAQIVLLGSPKDRPVAEKICANTTTLLNNLCGRTTLTEACALLAICDAVVTNDSGLMHVSAALKRPLVALFGSSDPRHTPPHSTTAKVEWLHLSCSPCFQRECPLEHLDCLRQLTPQHIYHSLLTLLP